MNRVIDINIRACTSRRRQALKHMQSGGRIFDCRVVNFAHRLVPYAGTREP